MNPSFDEFLEGTNNLKKKAYLYNKYHFKK
jgi:hypothetical protein